MIFHCFLEQLMAVSNTV